MSTNGFGGTEIVYILARQLITIAAMADVQKILGHIVQRINAMDSVRKKKNDALHRDMAEFAESCQGLTRHLFSVADSSKSKSEKASVMERAKMTGNAQNADNLGIYVLR
ncbi:hypothetical protein Tco_0457930 [Tanacetum coccineum]